MSFAPILQKIVDECSGVVGAALMGDDGIAIDQVSASRDSGDSAVADIGVAGVEFGRILEEIRKASDALGGGALGEALVTLARFSLLFRMVDAGVFLVIALEPDGNIGKARYLVRRHLLALREQL